MGLVAGESVFNGAYPVQFYSMLNLMLNNMANFPDTMAAIAPGGLRGRWMLEETDAVTGVSVSFSSSYW